MPLLGFDDSDEPTKVKFNAVKTFYSLQLIQRRSTESNCSVFHQHFTTRKKMIYLQVSNKD